MLRVPAIAVACLLAGACASQERPRGPVVVYPAAPDEPRIQFLASYSSSDDIEPPSSFRKFVIGEEDAAGERRLQKPYGASWWDERLYVCDPGLPHVVVFDFDRREMRLLGADGDASPAKPTDLAVAPDGFKYVTDTVRKRVLVYDDDDRHAGAFGDPAVWKPVGIAATDDRLYVTDVQRHCLVILDRKSGAEVGRVGAEGQGPGNFYYPLAVCVGPDGDVYVADSFNFRIQRLKPDGTFVRQYGELGRAPGQFSRLRGVAVDRAGRIYAVDAAFENIQVFDDEGRLLLFFAGPGSGPGDVNLPAAVRIDYDGAARFSDLAAPGHEIEYLILVTSQFGPNKVNVYGFLKKRG